MRQDLHTAVIQVRAVLDEGATVQGVSGVRQNAQEGRRPLLWMRQEAERPDETGAVPHRAEAAA